MTEVAVSSEDALQGLVARYPQLLSGDQEWSDGATGWLLVAREMGILSELDQGNRWAVDHLFLDHEGVPTVVKVTGSDGHRLTVTSIAVDRPTSRALTNPMCRFPRCHPECSEGSQVFSGMTDEDMNSSPAQPGAY